MADPSATPLSNSDFRKLLSTPRSERFASASSTPSRARSDASKPSEAKAKKPYRPKPKPKEEEEDGDEPKYRDRAEERRRGINPDYESANQLAAALPGDVDVSKLSVEETKFLGGDISHTHLVKGLDFALLQKERGKLTPAQESEAARATATATAAAAAAAKASVKGKDAMAAAAAAAAAAAVGKEQVAFQGPMARHVYNLLFNPPKTHVADMFLSRRMAFVYNFDEEDEAQDSEIPTTLRRSKADCPAVQESVFGSMDQHVLERLAKIMSYVKTAGGKKMKKKDRDELLGLTPSAKPSAHPGAAAAGPAGHAAAGFAAARKDSVAAPDDEEDIFGDAGTDYKPAVKKEKPAARAASSLPAPGPSVPGGEEDMDIEDGEVLPPPPLPPPPPAWRGAAAGTSGRGAENGGLPGPPAAAGFAGQQGADAGSEAYRGPSFRTDEERKVEEDVNIKWRVKAAKMEEKDVEFEEAAYAECYPMQAGFAGEVVDSDDEDVSQMDSVKGKSRFDFNTEEEWQQYKETREQMPKAAFQFGLKTADGRKAQKDVGDKAKESKMSSQLQKIERLLKDQGHEHGGAFKKPPPTPSRIRTEADFIDHSLTPARGKRQRI